jgi:hypothetical protein
MLSGTELGAAIEAARIAKNISKADLARQFQVKGPSVQGWVNHGRINKTKLFELMHFFSDTVGPEHWGMPAIAGADPRLSSFIAQITKDLQLGRLDDEDITMLAGIARRVAERNG